MNLLINTVTFFGKEFNIDPVAFNIGEKPIYWYGIIIAIGFCLALLFVFSEATRTGFSSDHIANVILIGTPTAIIFARIYYVIFNWKDYAGNPSEIIAVWHGGIAVYGSLIGAFLAGFLYCRYKKLSFLQLADICCGGFLIGQFIGRWGNFVNSEAYGSETTLPWKMGVMEMGRLIYVHPTFLYESLWNFVGFLIIFLFRKKKQYNGQLFYIYITWYGLGRIWIEGLRTDSLYFGSLRVSQMVALICIIVGSVLLIRGYMKEKSKI
ncbi:MAG: prolipoprotein diacylglyceryl transferase [Bacillota bacterium]|nr:prolipoprotein diacylglyceryl transferase [Bacillota bacterium]